MKILNSFYELLDYQNSSTTDIKYLNILKKLAIRMNDYIERDGFDDTVSIHFFKNFSNKLLNKFKGAKIEIKNIILEIYGLIWT